MAKTLKNEKISFRVNEEIVGFQTVRIVGEGVESKVLTFKEAIKIANSMEKDLIEINPKSNPPIIRVDNYDKFVYNMKKALKKKEANKPKPCKEIQLTVNIASNDLATKAKKAIEFVEDGSRVKVVLRMKGRELSRREESKRSIYQFLDMISEDAVPESMPKDEGNNTIVYVKRK